MNPKGPRQEEANQIDSDQQKNSAKVSSAEAKKWEARETRRKRFRESNDNVSQAFVNSLNNHKS